jgi:hypothetical protein
MGRYFIPQFRVFRALNPSSSDHCRRERHNALIHNTNATTNGTFMSIPSGRLSFPPFVAPTPCEPLVPCRRAAGESPRGRGLKSGGGGNAGFAPRSIPPSHAPPPTLLRLGHVASGDMRWSRPAPMQLRILGIRTGGDGLTSASPTCRQGPPGSF